MFGQNPLRKQTLEATTLRVQEVFVTIQGEGPFAGQPAIFVRLAGCNLKCHFCDTDFESNYDNEITAASLLKRIKTLAKDTEVKLLVITGGEPLLQPLGLLIDPMMESLHFKGWRIQIETAGTVWVPDLQKHMGGDRLTLVCSPKTPKLHPQIVLHTRYWKYIVRDGDLSTLDGLPTHSTQSPDRVSKLYRPNSLRSFIYLQPCDEVDPEKNRRNTKAAVDAAIKFGYTLCIQVHKTVGMP